MWIANTSWNAATWFPSLGYSYQLGLNSSHLTSGISEVAVEALGEKRQPLDRALAGGSFCTETQNQKCHPLQREWDELCPGGALSSSLFSQWPQTGCLRQLKLGEVTRPFPHIPRGKLKVLKQLRFFDSSVYADSMTQHLDISLDL